MAETVTSARKHGFLDISPGRSDAAAAADDKENNVPVLSLIQFSKAPFVAFGTVKLGTSRSAVLWSHILVSLCSVLQPEGVFSLTVTWTPSEEGGIRELIVFNANGVLKHQAVMLGRAEAPKKKKVSETFTSFMINVSFVKREPPPKKNTCQYFKKMWLMCSNVIFQSHDLTRTPVLSLKDALALIDSDLSNINASPRDSSSAFSDSLESKSGSRGGGPDGIVLGALPYSPELPESNEPRLTFFVSSKAVAAAAEDVATETVKRASFTSATVVKSRAPAEEHGSSGRKMKKSRRRLLEKTLELSDSSSQCDSGTSSPKLPVIDPDTVTNGRQNADVTGRLCDATRQVLEFTSSSPTPVTFPITSPPSMAPTRFSFSVTSPPPAATASISFTATGIQSFVCFHLPRFLAAIPRHPMPFAAKNMFYDERWIEKQERGFTWWINYVLTPDDFKVNTEVAKVSAVSLAMGNEDNLSVPKAPTKEEMSFSTYTARRKLNRLRRSACQLFTSAAMVKAIQRLELEVEAKRLLVRKDRHLWKDIGERRKVLNWLLSYNPLWMRIGLETIFGELISLESNSDGLGLAMFILQRLLWNPDIAAQFRHAKVPHLYKDGHEEALSRFTLKKLLLLVCFLDKAKESRLIEHDPCLFCVDAEFKTSKDLLLAFSRDFLSGEGILPRHLGYLGLPVTHVQKPLDEFNFAVKNLALFFSIVGFPFRRVMELLIQDWSLSAKLRLPAISRLQKVHNVDVALQVLKSKGLDLKDEHGAVIDSRDVVDGHREKTLSLLWKIIFAFHVILDEDQLREEIGFLKRTLSTKRRLVSLRADRGLQPSPAKTRQPQTEHSSTKINLLMDWARAVGDFYSLKVENFTVTFSDGRVLCYLIHHYHPGLLPEVAVSHSTTQTVECSPRGRLELSCSASDSDSPDSPSVEFKELLENEKNNFRLVNNAVAFLGGVPAMINPADMSNTIPNEKVVMSYLTFLCARLLDLRNETRAARVIQGAWRKYRLKKDLQLYKERNMAAGKIQLLVRSFLQRRRAVRRSRAAVVIQSLWRGHAARNMLRLQEDARRRALQHEAATVIQAQWRMFSATRAYQRLTYYAIVVQAQWRMRRAAAAYGRTYWAATVLQKRSRASALARRDRQRYLSLRAAVENHAATVIQAAFKTWYEGRRAERTSAAVRIQSWYRTRSCLRRYGEIKRSAILIQARYRGHAQRRSFEALKLRLRSAVVIQSAFRGHAVRKQVATARCAAVVIQRWFRATAKRDVQRRAFVRMRCAAVTVQAAYRGKVAREFLARRHKAASVIQAAFRRCAARRRYLALRRAAVVIQQKYRATVLARETTGDFQALRRSALVIQAHWRGRADRKRMETRHKCAALIQAHYRRHRAQAEYRSQKAAAVVIQRQFRAYVAGRETREAYLSTRAACVALQAGFRGMRVRKELEEKRQAATVIQSSVRMLLSRKRYVLLQSASIVIQSRYRALLLGRTQRTEYRVLRQAAVKIQAAYRACRVRADLRRRHSAARAIQAQFRMYRTRMAYLATKCAAIIIQERYRAKRLRDKEWQRATVVLQAAYRGQKVRREVAHWHHAATVIQSMFRKHREEVKFQAMRLSAIIIQRHYRSRVLQRQERERFLQLRQSAVVLQAAFRGHRVRSDIAEMHRAATVLQSHFKRHRQQSAFRRRRWAACVFQQRFRAQRQRDTEIKHYQEVRKAAIVLQAAYRGMKSRRNVKQSHQAASVIQRSYRTHCERRNYLTLKSSVLTVQRRYRATVAAKVQRTQYLELRSAAIVLQAAYRGQKVRREVAHWHRAATVIQSMFRKHREEVKFQAMRLSAVIIQRHYRSLVLQKQERERFLQLRQSAVVLQAAFRGHRVRSDIAEMHRAATVLQSHFKRHRQQSAFRRRRWAACVFQQRFRAQRQRDTEIKHYQEVRKAAIVLQAAYRGMKSRRNVKQRHQAASVLQRVYRAHSERKQYLKLKLSVLAIQRKYRATVSAKVQRTQYLETRSAAIVLQAAYRGQKVRQEVARRHRAATVIQSVFRKHREEVRFQALRLSAVIIQRHYRAHLLQRRDGEEFLKKKRSAILLQAAFRGRCVRREIGRRNRTAVVIQSRWRGLVQRRVFQRKREAAVTLQRRIRAAQRGRAQRNDYVRTRRAAVALQTHCRAWIARRQAAKAERRLRFTSAVFHHLSAMKIQRALRAHRALESAKRQIHSVVTVQRWVRARQQRRRYLEDRRKVVVAQRAIKRWSARRHDAASVIQQAVRRFLLLRRQQRVEQGIVKAQALWRGHRSRRLNDKPKVVRLRHRLRQVSAAVREEDKLCNKTSSALDYLLRYKHFSYILEALKNLETATRLSPECCERLVGSGATNVIFTLIRCCNRSVPCMDVITFSIQILLNLSKYHKTIEAVYSVENSVETLLDLLQRYREKAGDKVAEKGGGIFTKACFLLALLLQDQHRAAVRWLLRHANSNKLTGLKRQFAPDWVLRKDKLQDIVDPLRAIQMVADKLSIVL
uniref:Assembly factor for spindle microtubules n=1 Tax=Scophthalmus maximus TaxID=52904 RepID=A0A8D3BA27_SCOMX